jgi:hypothetical protein
VGVEVFSSYDYSLHCKKSNGGSEQSARIVSEDGAWGKTWTEDADLIRGKMTGVVVLIGVRATDISDPG